MKSSLENILKFNCPKINHGLYKWMNIRNRCVDDFLQSKNYDELDRDVHESIIEFFSLYFDGGFYTYKRRFQPVIERETSLEWVTKDFYYIKSFEYFQDQSYKIKDWDINFNILDADSAISDNNKEDDQNKRVFLMRNFSLEGKTISVDMSYVRDDKRPKSVKTKEYQKQLNEKYSKEILASIRDGESCDLVKSAPTKANPKRNVLGKTFDSFPLSKVLQRDYFIHKDLGGFLTRELDFYIKNEIMRLDDIESAAAPAVESYLKKIKIIRQIARDIIAFLAQLENFQKKLWLKKKFVVETNYCITLDRVPEELYEQIATNDAQREEWVKLFSINEIGGDLTTPGYTAPLTVDFLKANTNLVVDTQFFDDGFKAELISSIHDFDKQCDGLLVHSENFQALNFIQSRYFGQIGCVHIDPPYNTATSGFLYKNSYEHSSWMSMMHDRLQLAISTLHDEGEFICHIDENEYERLNLVFDSHSLVSSGTVIWDKKNPMLGRKGIATQHEYIIWKSKSNRPVMGVSEVIFEINEKAAELISEYGGVTENVKKRFNSWISAQKEFSGGERAYKYLDNNGNVYRLVAMGAPEKRTDPKYYVPLKHPVTGKDCAVPSNGWSRTPETLAELCEQNMVVFGTDESTQPQKKVFLREDAQKQITSVYRDGRSGKAYLDRLGLNFPYSHPVSMYEHLLSTTSAGSVFMDFFAGSGTNGHAVINLSREHLMKNKSILIEMGAHFDSVLKPRIAKVVYSSDWKNGNPSSRDTGISHGFKYIRLESYEDTLNNLVFHNSDDVEARKEVLKSNAALNEDYLLNYMLDVETKGSASLLNIDAFNEPTEYKLKIKKPGSEEYVERRVDLLETFNYLIGLRVNHIDKPQRFDAKFARMPDPDLPQDSKNTRLVVDGKVHRTAGGKWWFRNVTGWIPADPNNPNNGQQEKVLIIWRNLTDNLEEDNLMLEYWFDKMRIDPKKFEYDVIYVNGSNNLPNLKRDDETWKVRLLEEEFMKRMVVANKKMD